MRLLCAADLHLGRQPARLPDALRRRSHELAPAVAWRRLVHEAVARQVHAVLLAGDVLDDESDFFESYGDLKAGVEELVAAGIEVLAVSGNHDVSVLPRLAAAVPRLRLLGAGGRWERATLDDGERTVQVLGWSYPGRVVERSPLPGMAEALEGATPGAVIGLLHCDRDQTGSRYAPVTSTELAAAPVDAWVLGHVHRPDAGATGYVGSLSAADPGEEGAHGARLLEVGEDGITATVVPLSPLRFEALTVDVGALRDAGDLDKAVTGGLDRLHAALRARTGSVFGPGAPDPTVAVGCRLRLIGRSGLRADLARRLATDDPRDLELQHDGVSYFIHDARLEVLPLIDLATVAAGGDPLGLMARKLIVLDGPPSPERAALLAAGRRRLGEVATGRYYGALAAPEFGDEDVAARLRQAALALIDEMAGA